MNLSAYLKKIREKTKSGMPKATALSSTEFTNGETDTSGSGSKLPISLEQAYSRDKASLEHSKNMSQQQADITLQKLKKYIPVQLKAQGLDGLGISSEPYLDAYNNYMNTMANIETEHSALQSELAKNYRDQYIAEQDKLKAEEEKKEAKLKESQNEVYSDALAIIEGGYYSEPEKLQDYIKTLDGKVRDNQYSVLEQMVNSQLNSAEEKERKKLLEEEKRLEEINKITGDTAGIKFDSDSGDDMEEGDNFDVISGEESLEVESGGKVTDSDIIYKAYDLDDGTVFGYAGKIYVKKNGDVYKVQGTSATDSDYNTLYNLIYPGAGTEEVTTTE